MTNFWKKKRFWVFFDLFFHRFPNFEFNESFAPSKLTKLTIIRKFESITARQRTKHFFSQVKKTYKNTKISSSSICFKFYKFRRLHTRIQFINIHSRQINFQRRSNICKIETTSYYINYARVWKIDEINTRTCLNTRSICFLSF